MDDSSLVRAGSRRYGRFAARPACVNPLDESAGLERTLRRLRLKEWLGFTLIHRDWFSSLIMQDANYLASSEIYAYDPLKGVLYQHAASVRGGSLRLPEELPGSKPLFVKNGYLLAYKFSPDGNRHVLRFDIAATAKAPAFNGELTLHGDRASAPLSVSARIPGGKLYTHKAIYPAEGQFRVGDLAFTFDPARDMAILDEHKSFLPYRTTWLWGTFATQLNGRPVGANFARRPSLPGEEDESCVWTPTACEPLSGVEFAPARGGPLASWRVTSADGRLDVTFTPTGRKDVKHQLGLFAIDYFQLFGSYHGTLRGADGTAYPVEAAHGVCENFRARL